ncbi:MAG: hypothetical protein AAGF74_13685 [Pseudomonadota bacterium]
MISNTDNHKRLKNDAAMDAGLLRFGVFALAWCIGGGAAMMLGILG